jgi:cobalt-zinc-cadmium efflux system membrane fusion protein
MTSNVLYFLASFFMLALHSASAHEGHDHNAPPGSAAAQEKTATQTTTSNSNDIVEIHLSEQSIHNLGIATEFSLLKPRAEHISIQGTTTLPPEKQRIITPTAAGTITAIHHYRGEHVVKGAALFTLQPLFVGSRPIIISSPIMGIITKQMVSIGQSVTPESSIMEIGDYSELLIEGILYETPEQHAIAIGQKVEVTSSLFNTPTATPSPLQGKIIRMDSEFEKPSNTLRVYALVTNPAHRLRPHMQVTMLIETGTKMPVLTIPRKAILGEQGAYFVYVRDGQWFERRQIRIGQTFGHEYEILEGIFPNEQIVTTGNYQLQFAKTTPRP